MLWFWPKVHKKRFERLPLELIQIQAFDFKANTAKQRNYCTNTTWSTGSDNYSTSKLSHGSECSVYLMSLRRLSHVYCIVFDCCVQNWSVILSSVLIGSRRNLAANHTSTWQCYSCIPPRNRRWQRLHKRRKMPNDVQAQCYRSICELPGEAKERTEQVRRHLGQETH